MEVLKLKHEHGDGGKQSAPRDVDKKKYETNWDLIWGKKEEKKDEKED